MAGAEAALKAATEAVKADPVGAVVGACSAVKETLYDTYPHVTAAAVTALVLAGTAKCLGFKFGCLNPFGSTINNYDYSVQTDHSTHNDIKGVYTAPIETPLVHVVVPDEGTALTFRKLRTAAKTVAERPRTAPAEDEAPAPRASSAEKK
jgi:hypothetical protein